jgi:hypothetical protein
MSFVHHSSFIGRLFRLMLLGLVVLVVLAPNLIARSGLRDAMLQAGLPQFHGRITSGSAFLGWFYPVEFRQIVIRGDDGQPVISIAELKGDRPLWKLLLHPRAAGTFVIENARLDVQLKQSERGNNLDALIGGNGQRHSGLNVGFALQIVGGTLAVHSPGSPQAWTVTPINIAMEVVPPASGEGSAELVLDKGTVVDHLSLTSPMCGDLLKYVLPVLSETTDVSGQFSVALDGWRVPLDDPAQGTGSGRFSIHRMDVSSLMLQRLSQSLHIPATVRVAEESVVQFSMAGRRVSHEGLTFGTPQVTLRTQGSVGLDQSLDLLAEIAVHPVVDSTPLQSPLLKDPFQVPIHGTLTHPRVDIRQAGRELLQNLVGDVLKMKLPDGQNLGAELGKQDPLAPGGAIDELLKQQPLQKLFGNRKSAGEQ